jgi:hypothetical protein
LPATVLEKLIGRDGNADFPRFRMYEMRQRIKTGIDRGGGNGDHRKEPYQTRHDQVFRLQTSLVCAARRWLKNRNH